MAIQLDHLVVAARSLIEGEDWVAGRLGVAAGGHGAHRAMGTHNALWRLGDVYLEVIAVDPAGIHPGRPRWFGFDDPRITAALEAGPMLLTWAVAVDDGLERLAADAPAPHGRPQEFARDDLTWQVALPDGHRLPLGGAWPLTIRWTGGRHPTGRLPETGLTLERLTIRGEHAAAAEHALGAVEGPVSFEPTAAPVTLVARIGTPIGAVTL